jgi:hydroxyethylthiazole kinase-like uncharacterized protein yjeF
MAAQQSPRPGLAHFLVTAEQMQQVEAKVFDAGMPVAALMEKVAGLITDWIVDWFPVESYSQVGVLVGPGHNGGDALVVARELCFRGYLVAVYCPLTKQKSLTAEHLSFARSLGIEVRDKLDVLSDCQLIIDGLFGFGQGRPLEGALAQAVEEINRWSKPVVSIDLPSGIHTDSGAVLGVAVQATHTLCLGLWKRAFCQDHALDYLGQRHLIDFDLPETAVHQVLGEAPLVQRLTEATALARLPLPRAANTHKYKVGQLLVIAGSRQYSGAALLTGLGARASGVGMLTLAVPESLRPIVISHLPEALVVGCPETTTGAIRHLPDDLDLNRYDAIACGPGLSQGAQAVLQAVLPSSPLLVLDADALNLLAQEDPIQALSKRGSGTLLTPHPGEYKRLFPNLESVQGDAGEAAQQAAAASGAVVLLKGACSAIAHPDGRLWYNPDSTSALARGGSGDVLTGLCGGLLAQQVGEDTPSLDKVLDAALAATWWHAKAAQWAANEHTELGVDAPLLANYLDPTLAEILS